MYKFLGGLQRCIEEGINALYSHSKGRTSFEDFEVKVTTAPTGGWYDIGKDVKGLILVDDIEKAKTIEGNLNLKSCFNRIYDAIRYGDFTFNKIEIVRVENESSKTL